MGERSDLLAAGGERAATPAAVAAPGAAGRRRRPHMDGAATPELVPKNPSDRPAAINVA
ncbi:hypothetical protein HYG77_38670 (plasmid) [Rhodococcus sp. ZPP]|uniref:hypothetical protein n=1 Tax=Rhodococcus sp. ZPP TaxID=2749906 RepID=UPI001AD89BF9|nr:hypothetical protein [Rhodococcus sp. ZPP]QTJ71366.1 hypothetical protein HYG77_38670 [Rhodococcus sp. ZPP]